MKLFREALLERLVTKHAISEELKARLLSWRHPGFSTHVGEPIPPQDTRVIEDMASYVMRNPVSLKRLVYIDGQQAVVYRALRPNPGLGANSPRPQSARSRTAATRSPLRPCRSRRTRARKRGGRGTALALAGRGKLEEPAGSRGVSPFAGAGSLRGLAPGSAKS